MLVISIFSFSPQCSLPMPKKFRFFSHIYFVVCKCCQDGPLYKSVTWLRIKGKLLKNNGRKSGTKSGRVTGLVFFNVWYQCLTFQVDSF